ncbi:diadenosine tetraphosphate hydrolase [Candidatus Woesearchaeota archaeon]|nr:diadenosine tetraphosphate hydrolase [Candidatus Woesearchaeota archaeon]
MLGNHPNTKGVTLVLTKQHYDSYVFDMNDDIYNRFMIAAKKVVKILEKGLGVQRVAMVMEGMGLNHAHIKLYPLHGLTEKFTEMWGDKEVYFDKYEGYVTTLEGPLADMSTLRTVAKEIKENQ